MGFVLIEHDLDIALGVAERVTVMHNGRVLKHGTPRRDQNDARSAGDLHGREGTDGAACPLSAMQRRPVGAGARSARPRRLLRPRACAAGREPDAASGVLGIVGRNGMGKTTLCNAITGLVPARGSVKLAGRGDSRPAAATDHRARHRLCAAGPARVAVADGRRDICDWWQERRQGAWTVERIYSMFPRLAERTGNGGAELSGGEQQMLAIGRALLLNPRLLVMDEPTEGLAPVIVEQVVADAEAAGATAERRDRGAADRAEPRRRDRRGRPHRP